MCKVPNSINFFLKKPCLAKRKCSKETKVNSQEKKKSRREYCKLFDKREKWGHKSTVVLNSYQHCKTVKKSKTLRDCNTSSKLYSFWNWEFLQKTGRTNAIRTIQKQSHWTVAFTLQNLKSIFPQKVKLSCNFVMNISCWCFCQLFPQVLKFFWSLIWTM